MELSTKEKEEIAKEVANILAGRKHKVSHSWIALRKEIGSYCQDDSKSIRWSTLQTKIYDAIRACLDISRLDEMTEEQVPKAKKVFEFIKQERWINKHE